MLDMGLWPNSIQKLAQELRFSFTLINDPSPKYSSNVGLPTRPLTCGGRTSKPTCVAIEDSGPQPIGPDSDTMLEMGLGLNSTQKLA
jgi:hypothetical protein